MPDLNDLDADLRALLAARAVDAPAAPAPTEALVRRVRRRQAIRATAAVATGSLALVAIVAVAAAAVRPDRQTVTPAKPSPSALIDDRYEFCDKAFVSTTVPVETSTTELKFDRGCYTAKAGVPLRLSLLNPTTTPHNVVVAPEDGEPFAKTETVFADVSRKVGFDSLDIGPLAAGDYRLTCDVHPQMTAQLVVR